MLKFNRTLNKLLMSLLLITAPLFTQSVLASGGLSLPSGGGGGAPGQVRVVDELYESGKQIYKGRANGAEKITYCVDVDGELKKLRRGSIKMFKGGSRKDFALALLDCDNPERLALTTMQREQVPIVLYYLEKRFRLDLQDA